MCWSWVRGPAGLEAARVAAERGHRVEIVEASGVVGGQFRLAGMQPRRGQILELMDWYERQFDKLGVTLRLNTFLEAEEVAAHGAEVVVVATGSLPDETGFQRWVPSEARLCRGSRRGACGRPRPSCGARRGWGTRWWSMTRAATGAGSGRPGRWPSRGSG
jgi:hypothetical protein